MINGLDTSVNCESISKSNSIIISAIQYMEKNYTTCTLEETANAIGTNPCYLTTLLKKHFQKSYKELIIQLRLNYAAKMLINSHNFIDDIAYQCGYKNITFFTKI